MAKVNEGVSTLEHHTLCPVNQIIFGVVNRFWYRNYKGEREYRTVIPHRLSFRATPHHPEAGWILECMDVDRRDYRSFSLKDIETV